MTSAVPPPGFDPKRDTTYGYIPTRSICVLFLTLFGLSTLAHIGTAFYFGMYWLLATAVMAGIGELIGWSGRYWSSTTFALLAKPFFMQITCTIIAPTFLLAAYFILLKRIILLLGPEYSRLAPQKYSRIFLTIDIFCLVIQAVGGSSTKSNTGAYIMLAGIAFQLVSLTIYVALCTEFLVRYNVDRPVKGVPYAKISGNGSGVGQLLAKRRLLHLSRRLQLFLIGMAFSILCIIIRGIYRTVELSGGWRGHVIRTQVYFNVLDGTMILLATLTLNILHPGYLLPETTLAGGSPSEIELFP